MAKPNEKKFYITTPIYYVNAEPHLGHAYTTIVADVISRYHRLAGFDTFFLTGTDEHGIKVVEAAEKANETVSQYVARISAAFRNTWPGLNISNDYFIRTTDLKHKDTVRKILSRVHEKGDIYFSEYEGKYCKGCERFYTDTELEDGKCPIHKEEPEIIREENYFFRMSKYQSWLIDYIRDNPDFIRPERYKNEVLSFLRDPLEDLCISRPKKRLSWGISLPFDENYVTYVWFDALINYISALDYPDGKLFKKFWPVVQHIIAKDILKPHGIFWPCMLKAAGIEPYRNLNVHGYWNVDAGKMSKSLGNIVRPLDLATKYGLDAFRYFLMREMVFGLDSDFSEEALVNRLNSDLANDLGNLVSRSITMAVKYFGGVIPETVALEGEDFHLKETASRVTEDYHSTMRKFGFHKALMLVWELIGAVNKYIDTMKPWEIAKSNQEHLSVVLNNINHSLKIVSMLLWPFMPQTCEKIQRHLGLEKVSPELNFSGFNEWGKPNSARPIEKIPPLFPRVNFRKGKEAEKQTSSQVTISDFQKLDLRIGVIREAEKIAGSEKLLKIEVDVGEKRTIVAGLAGHYEPDQLKGKQATVVANLEPAKLMGIESQGMLLAAEDPKGVHLLVPDANVKPGSKIK